MTVRNSQRSINSGVWFRHGIGAAEPQPQLNLRFSAAPQRFLAAALRRRRAAAAALCGKSSKNKKNLRLSAAKSWKCKNICGSLRQDLRNFCDFCFKQETAQQFRLSRMYNLISKFSCLPLVFLPFLDGPFSWFMGGEFYCPFAIFCFKLSLGRFAGQLII